MTHLVLGAAHLRFERFVLGLELGVADRVLLGVILEKGADEDRLAHGANLRDDVRFFVDPCLLGFLHQQFAADQLFAHGIS